MISIYSAIKSLTYSVLLLLICQQYGALRFHEKKISHEAKVLDNNEISQLANVSNADYFVRILQNICIPRVVGSHTHEKVKEFIMEELIELGWSVELDSFRARTPQFGELKFSNVVGRLNPEAERYLVLSCHYDSKFMREQEFLGATDSAVPCAMMLDLADKLKGELESAKQSELSLMLIFFDGEEAFQQWSSTDSIYGARNLAYVWYNKPYPGTNDTTNNLHRMDLLVLLDLLGAVGPQFYNYFTETERWHRQLVSAERRLHRLGYLAAPRRSGGYFLEKSTFAHVEDDHLPFLRAGVPVLHVIPQPFPDVWHTSRDNWSILDFNTIDDLSKILRVFVVEYLRGSQNLDTPEKSRASRIEI